MRPPGHEMSISYLVLPVSEKVRLVPPQEGSLRRSRGGKAEGSSWDINVRSQSMLEKRIWKRCSDAQDAAGPGIAWCAENGVTNRRLDMPYGLLLSIVSEARRGAGTPLT